MSNLKFKKPEKSFKRTIEHYLGRENVEINRATPESYDGKKIDFLEKDEVGQFDVSYKYKTRIK